MLCNQLLFKIAILGVLCSVGRSKSLLEVTESSTDTIPDTTIEPLESTNTTEDDLIQLTTLSDPDHDTPDDVERIHHYHHHKDKDNDRDKIIIVQQNPSRPNYEYDQYCYGQNEVWSTSIKCDVRCDYEGNEDDDRYGYGHYRGQNKDYLRYSCYRTVSDVDLEEGKINVTSLEALGYPPEPKEHFEARTIDLDMVKQLRGIPLRHRDHYDDDDDHYLVLQQNQPPYHRPAGRCVCRPDHARLNGKCVSRRYCPCKYLFNMLKNISSYLNLI